MNLALTVHLFFLLSLLLPALLVVTERKKFKPNYRPFGFFILTSFIIELVKFMLPELADAIRLNAGVQNLMEALFLCSIGKAWGFFGDGKKSYYMVMAMLLLLWILLNFIVPYPGWFTVLYSVATVLMAIQLLIREILTTREPLSRNTIFLACMAFIIGYSFSGLLAIFMSTGQYSNPVILEKTYLLSMSIVILTNIIYLKSVVCIPRKIAFLSPW